MDAPYTVAFSCPMYAETEPTRMTEDCREKSGSGEITDTSTPEAQTQLLLYIVQGLSLISRTGLDRTAALAAIDTALDGLRA
ncbi:hypothetical protein [Streptomyces achromogenes]|uniref:hypothetical protein n=1 Tax=Streptomyces achromogenes TaxID=67255 RepID=UPI0036ABC4BD